MAQKIIFFTEGNVPTKAEQDAIAEIEKAIAPKFETVVRNAAALAIYGEGRNEPADFVAGSPPSNFPNYTPATAATGTLRVATNPAAGETIAVAGTVFEFVAANPTGNQILIAANAAATAGAIRTAVNALADVNAAGATNVIEITAAVAGVAGNAIAIVNNGAKITRSGPRLTGGTEATGYPTFDPKDV